MSHTAHIPSHRKPRRGASKTAIRSGVAGGVLSTIALAGAAAPANAEPVTETIEMPTLTAGLAGSVAQSAAATQQVADSLDLRAQEDAAATHAAKVAKKAKAEAQRKAEAKEKAAAAARAKAAEERASRSEERTTLAASSGSSAPASNASTQATGSAAAVLAFARAQVGDAYVLGSTGPNSWDCSSLVQAAYRQAGIDLPRTSQPQSTAGTQVPGQPPGRRHPLLGRRGQRVPRGDLLRRRQVHRRAELRYGRRREDAGLGPAERRRPSPLTDRHDRHRQYDRTTITTA